MEILDVDNSLEALRRHRRALHRIPELGFDLPQTQAYVLSQLAHARARVETVAGSGVLAFFDAGKRDTVAFRCDMDALAVTEPEGCAFASEHPGRMHACGHDAHMSIALCLAEHLSQRAPELPRNVLLIFQPAEETGGGAQRIVESGALERYGVSRIFALHVQPSLPSGALSARAGAMMATSAEVHIRLRGASVHAARFREGRDAMLAGAEAVRGVYAFERSLPPQMPRLIRLCSLHAGTSTNIVPELAELSGTVRAFSAEDHAQVKAGVERAVRAACAPLGVEAEVRFSEGYPPTVNDPALFSLFLRAVDDMDVRPMAEPDLTTEDFSFYQQRVPGLMFFLGVGPGEALHSPRFALDERALVPGLSAFKRLAALKD